MKNSENNPNPTIQLLDGTVLTCTLREEPSAPVKYNGIELDNTGVYLSMVKNPKLPKEDDLTKAARKYSHRLFTDNAWFLLDNADKVFADSRMFLAPVHINNHLAYLGRNGFEHPTVGVYLEWWKNHSQAATDAKGNLVWYIAGSPLSGSNCCATVDRKGEIHDMEQRTQFLDIWKSFVNVNNRYNDAKSTCEAYTLEELLIVLRGQEYRQSIDNLWLETIGKVKTI